jgi:hypothetical protein
MDRSVKIDYFCFTTRRSPAEVCALFVSLPNPLQAQERGMFGYHFSFTSPDGVNILYTPGRPDTHIQLTGRGCDAMGHFALVDKLLVPGDHVTRLDVAVDCLNSGTTCSDIWGLLRRGDVISLSSNIRHIEGVLQSQGHTIYVGASSSERMVRIYDKGAEQQTGTDWLRFEVQLRGKSANQFFLLVSSDGNDFSKLSLSLLGRQIRLLADGQGELLKNEHHSRAKTHPFWEALTDCCAPLVMAIQKPIKTARSLMRYVRNSGAALKTLKGAMSDFEEWLDGVVEDAKLKDHHRAIQDDLNDYGQCQSDSYDHYLRTCTI